MTDFKIKMAELAAKYNISHKRDIDWHNFVAEVEQLTEEQPEKDCAELIESSRALYFDLGFCITELLRARREGNEQHECNALSRMEGLMNESQQQLSCIIDYLERQKEQKKEDEHLLSAIQVQFASHAKVENGKRYAKLTWDEFKKIAFELCGRGKPKPAEQTEVDLEQEVISYFQGMWPGIDANTTMSFTPPAIMRLVKHFYGLGKEQNPKVMQEVSDNVDKLRAISTPADEDWFKIAEEWEKEDKK